MHPPTILLSRPATAAGHHPVRFGRPSLARLLFLGAIATPLHAQAPQPGLMQGSVVDARGAALADARIVADNTLLFNTNALGVSDAQGRYRIDVSRPVGTWVGSATITRIFNGRRYVLDLDPGTDDPFAGNEGAVRNFTWKLRGERRDGLGTYGMSVIYYFAVFQDPDFPEDFLDTDHVELTLTPVGALIDGSSGEVITAFGSNSPDGPAIRDVPVARYRITARYLPPGRPPRPLLLRVRNSGEFVPALTTDFVEVIETLYQIEMDVTFDVTHVFDSSFEARAA